MHVATATARADGGPKKRLAPGTVQRSMYLPEAVADRLPVQAAFEKRSQSNVITLALRAYYAAHPVPGFGG
jgi:hypothetical protein